MPAETHTHHAPLDRDGVLRLVRDRLAEVLDIDAATVREDSTFTGDLAADSLALIELVEILEDELGERTVGFHFEDEDLEDLETVRDTVDYVVARLH